MHLAYEWRLRKGVLAPSMKKLVQEKFRVDLSQGTNKSISFLSPLSAVSGVALGLPQILNGGRFFDKQGQRMKAPGMRYQENGVRIPF